MAHDTRADARCTPSTELQNIEQPANEKAWCKQVKEYLRLSNPAAICLSDLTRWKIGPRMANPSGSKLMYEHFLHFRAFIVSHHHLDFDLRDFVDEEYATAASKLLEKGAWEDFDYYRRSVENSDPDIRILGQFASAKVEQNHVLIDAYCGPDNEKLEGKGPMNDDLEEDSDETPSRRVPTKLLPMKPNYRSSPPFDCDAADEMIVNKAMAGFVSILTRPFTKEFTRAQDSPSKRLAESDEPSYDLIKKGLARWTIARNRFHIKERRRDNDSRQAVTDAKCEPGQYFKLLETQTDGHLYSPYETLALIEVKARKRDRTDAGRMRIEWQETAEIFAWQNNCLRMEQEQSKTDVSRRFLKPPAEPNRKRPRRCLLISQDREQCYIVVGEFDAYWEYYCVEGRLPGPKTAPSSADLSTKMQQLRLGDERLKHYGLDGCPAPGPEDGFLAIHVYGPFLTTDQDDMVALSTNLIGLTMHLAGVTGDTLKYFERTAQDSVKKYKAGRASSGSETSQGSEDSLWVQRSSLFS